MEQSFTVAPSDFAATLATPAPVGKSLSPATPVVDSLTTEQQAAVSAAWAATNTTIAAEYEVSIASSDEGGWTVVRVAAVHKVV